MILRQKPLQAVLHSLGYKEDKQGSYKKPFSNNPKKPFPRFHININDDYADIHIDNDRIHGFFAKWLNKSKKNNIINNSPMLQAEAKLIELEHIYLEAKEIKKQISDKVNQLSQLRKKL